MACSTFQVFSHLTISLWLVHLITSNITDHYHCLPVIIVQRNTVWKARVMDTVKINCTLEKKCFHKLSIIWCKFDGKSKCEPLNKSKFIRSEIREINESFAMSFLIFENISRKDSGLYRCEYPSSFIVPHPIFVNVADVLFDNSDLKVLNKGNSTNSSDTTDFTWLWSYLYIGSGVVLLVIIVLVLIIWCQVKKSRKSSTGTSVNQTTATQMADVSSSALDNMLPNVPSSSCGKTHRHLVQLNTPQPCIYDNIPLGVVSQRQRSSPPRLPDLPRCNHGRDKMMDEEDNHLVYASLNHDVVQHGSVRVTHTGTETSEYAAIKIS